MCVNVCLYENRRRSDPRSPSTNKLMIHKMNENRKGGLSISLQPFLLARSIIQCIHKRSICFRLFLNIKSLHPLVQQIFCVWVCVSQIHRGVLSCSGSHVWFKPSACFYLCISCTTRISSRQTVCFKARLLLCLDYNLSLSSTSTHTEQLGRGLCISIVWGSRRRK